MESNEGRKIVLEKERRLQRRKENEYHPIFIQKDDSEINREKKIRRGFKQMHEQDYDRDYDR